MKKLLKFSALVLVVGLVLGLVGCKDDEKEEESGIDYTNYISDYSIKVKNDTNKKLVAFKGSPDPATLISGIPIGGGEHGLKKDPTLFATTGDFVLFLVTEEDYLANKGNLSVLVNKPFTRLYAFYNTNYINNITYTINSILGGNKRIVLQNATDYNVELRMNGPQGQIIGYTLAQTYNTVFFVAPDDYMVFPVFRKFNRTLGEILSAHPLYGPGNMGLEGKAIFEEFSLIDANEVTINASNYTVRFTTGAALLRVVNNSLIGIGLWDGYTRQTTESGAQVINPNSSLYFPIYMGKTGENTFEEKETRGAFKIGTSASQRQVDSNDYYEGKIYRIEVTGANANNLTFSSITETGDFDF